MKKIVQVQRCDLDSNLVTICVSDISGKNRSVFYCPLDLVGNLIVCNL